MSCLVTTFLLYCLITKLLTICNCEHLGGQGGFLWEFLLTNGGKEAKENKFGQGKRENGEGVTLRNHQLLF